MNEHLQTRNEESAPERIPFKQRLALPVITAPMFLVSGVEMVVAACRAGVVGSFPASNARTIADLDAMCQKIASALAEAGTGKTAPWAMNVITHATYERLNEELQIIDRYRPELVITALGSPSPVLKTVKPYGGSVYADVATVAQAKKAIALGVDGLVLLSAGAGGHTGIYNPFAFVREVRRFWSGPLVLSGGIADAACIRAAEALGADLVYMGTRMIASTESMVSDEYRKMLVDASLEDIVTSAAVTGVAANWLRASLEKTGWTAEKLSSPVKRSPDFSGDLAGESKAWKDVWGAGQGVGLVKKIEPMAEIVASLRRDYDMLGMRGMPL